MRRKLALIVIGIGCLVGASSRAAATNDSSTTETCVDVQIGTDRTPYYDCLNLAISRSVAHERNAPSIEAPIGAGSSPNQVGTFTDAAAREKMGNAYGVSSQPQRPHPVFANPLAPLR